MYRIILLFSVACLYAPWTHAGTAMPAAGHYVDVGGNARLYYHRAGAGKPMLLVPGWSFNGDIFAQQISHFSRTHDVIAVDPRGQGRSTKSAEGNSYRQHGKDIAALLQALQLGPAIFVGWSWGCYDILSYQRQFGGARISRFVCLDEPPRGWSSRPEEWAEVNSLETFDELYHDVADRRRAFTEEFVKSAVTRPLTGEELKMLVSMSFQTPDHVALALAVDGMLSDYSAEAARLARAIPTLYILREESRARATPWMAEHMPATRVLFRGGHLMFWEFPEEINAAIDTFISPAD